jgi:predicted DNA-binding transcriptional regulator AlpA
MQWQVHIAIELDQPGDDTILSQLDDALAKHDAAVAGEGQTIEATMTIDGPATPETAIRESFNEVAVALAGHTIRSWTAGEAITTAEADRRLDEPTIPDLVSGVEAAEILGVSRQRVHQLAAENPTFPPAVARLASGSVWLRSGVEGFARTWTRKPGRPAKAGAHHV